VPVFRLRPISVRVCGSTLTAGAAAFVPGAKKPAAPPTPAGAPFQPGGMPQGFPGGGGGGYDGQQMHPMVHPGMMMGYGHPGGHPGMSPYGGMSGYRGEAVQVECS
jgi:hypothetical protein